MAFVRKVFILLLVCAVSCGSTLRSARAGESCDPEFQTMLDQRAILQGTQDMEAAQAIILRPDPVLEYSCFLSQTAMMGEAAKTLFSDAISDPKLFLGQNFTPQQETQFQPTFNSPLGPKGMAGEPAVQFDTPHPMGEQSLASLTAVVVDPAERFRAGSFPHGLAGGKLGNSSDICGAMAQVWMTLKCTNFDPSLFVSIADMGGGPDPRVLPKACADPQRATRISDALAVQNPPAASPPKKGGVERVDSQLRIMNPTAEYGITPDASCALAQPLPTGLVVSDGQAVMVDGETVQEYVCTIPGCSPAPRAESTYCVPTHGSNQ